jgi:hypothetical protein
MRSTMTLPWAAAESTAARWLVPLLIGVAAGLLYLVNLNRLPHPDELHHALAARGLLESGEPRIAEGLYTRALLHTWLVAESYQLFGDSLVAARIPSVVCMAALVGLLFAWLQREAGAAAAWLGAGLFAISPFAIGPAQFARFYAPQCLCFFLATILIYEAVLARGDRRRRLLCGVLAMPVLLLAIYFQVTTLMGTVGLGLWVVVALGLPWLTDPIVPRQRKLAVLASLGAIGLVLLLALASSGILKGLWYRYRWTPLFDRATANEFWFYHAYYILYYPTLWPLTGVLALFGLAAAPRPVAFALTIFTVGFLLNSFGASKGFFYIAYAHPFLFAIWGTGLVAVLPSLLRSSAALVDRLAPMLGPAGRRGAGFLIGGVILFLILANPAWVRSAALLADITVPPERSKPNWMLAKPELMPWLERADVVVTTEELATLYYLGRYDIRFSRSKLEELPAEERRDFGRDHRTGRPVVGSREALERIFACYATGIILGPMDSWNKAHIISPEIGRLIIEHGRPLELPSQSRIYAYVWEHAGPPLSEADCAGLPKFRNRLPAS